LRSGAKPISSIFMRVAGGGSTIRKRNSSVACGKPFAGSIDGTRPSRLDPGGGLRSGARSRVDQRTRAPFRRSLRGLTILASRRRVVSRMAAVVVAGGFEPGLVFPPDMLEAAERTPREDKRIGKTREGCFVDLDSRRNGLPPVGASDHYDAHADLRRQPDSEHRALLRKESRTSAPITV
jgi:hypothetical protein